MIQTIKKAWGIPELRKKIIFTALILLIFRIGNAIPVPYVNTDLLSSYLEGMSTTVLGLYNVMSGGAFAQATVFALGVQPYINSSIIIQLLTIAIPSLERLQKEGGEEGRKKLEKITRYTTIGLGLVMGFAYWVMLKNYTNQGYAILGQSDFISAAVIILSFTAGSAFVMWLGEQITEFGIGNGISIILFAGILSRVPSMVSSMISGLRAGTLAWWAAVLVVLGILALIVLITWVNGAERRIPVQYAKRQVGRKMYGGQASTLPMKVNMSGVLPIIFAQSIAMIPSTIAAFCKQPAEGTFWYGFLNAIDTKSVLYMIFYFLMIRPENKRKKQAEEMRSALKKGDWLTTIGGIYGRVVAITDRTVVIETSEDRVRVEFLKSAIGQVGTLDQQAAAQQRPAKKDKKAAEEKIEEKPAETETKSESESDKTDAQ